MPTQTRPPKAKPAARTSVATFILSDAAIQAADTYRGDRTFGEAVEALIVSHLTKVKLPRTELRLTASKRPLRIAGRAHKRSVRLAPDVNARLTEYCDSRDAVRSDVVDALLVQYARTLGGASITKGRSGR